MDEREEKETGLGRYVRHRRCCATVVGGGVGAGKPRNLSGGNEAGLMIT